MFEGEPCPREKEEEEAWWRLEAQVKEEEKEKEEAPVRHSSSSQVKDETDDEQDYGCFNTSQFAGLGQLSGRQPGTKKKPGVRYGPSDFGP